MKNGESIKRADVPKLAPPEFQYKVVRDIRHGARIGALFCTGKQVLAALAKEGEISLLLTDVELSFPSITADCPAAHPFERSIQEEFGIKPQGHPWPKAMRALAPQTDFFQVRGDQVHEVAVGPVHAGVIEPGHFRFQCDGERVMNLQIQLGYQHRGVARALVGGPNKRTIHYVETLAGDTSVGHATAYCEIVESLSGVTVTPRAHALRAVALELERLANHTGDLGAMANDVGYLPTASFCGRLRGDWLNMSAVLCGSRFGRGMVRPGGVGFDVDTPRVSDLLKGLESAARDVEGAVQMLWSAPSVLARFETTGAVTGEIAQALGLVGVAARASGLDRDARKEFPWGHYRVKLPPVATAANGDVYARAQVRALEIERSVAFVRDTLAALPPGEPRVPVTGELATNRVAVSIVEGWRGEICHVALTNAEGRFERYEVVDPSVHNWAGLAMALREQEISDFPLCNKSFNLSYCGHDL